MSQSSAMPYPRDDNLRLILAEGHEAWLHKKIAATKQRMVLMIAATALAVAGLSGVMGYWLDGREPGAVTTNLIVVTSLVLSLF